MGPRWSSWPGPRGWRLTPGQWPSAWRPRGWRARPRKRRRKDEGDRAGAGPPGGLPPGHTGHQETESADDGRQEKKARKAELSTLGLTAYTAAGRTAHDRSDQSRTGL